MNDRTKAPVKWCEISDASEKIRFEVLSQEIKKAGRENTLEFLSCDEATFSDVLAKAEKEFDGIRLSGNASEWILTRTEHIPALTASLQFADAMTKEIIKDGTKPARWWAHCFMFDGLNRSLASSPTTPDISGAVFILGAQPVTRILIGALSRIGFTRFNVVDPDETKAQVFCEMLKKKFFGLEIHSVARHYMTQLPGIHSVAINVIAQGKDDGAL
ncbi:MAG: hypothetical protein V4692_04660, partial [Bdellovibrionota bacterium]